MAVQQMTGTMAHNQAEARAIRRAVMVILAVAIEAVLIGIVVLSSIGTSADYHPTPAGAYVVAPLPAPASSY
jgi:hypothetical protein